MQAIEIIEIRENAVYTFEEVCKILKTSDSNLRSKLQEGALRFVKLGRQYRFLGKDLLAFMQGKQEDREFFLWLERTRKKKKIPALYAGEASELIHEMRSKRPKR